MSALEWTQIILVSITTFGTITCTAISAFVWYQVRTPSGDRIGVVAERTEHLASASVAHTTHLVSELNGERRDTDDGTQ